jgi:lactate permease
MPWTQLYDPFGSLPLSALCAAVPIVCLLGALGFLHWPAHRAALLGLAAALAVAILAYGMPVALATRAAVFGGAYGLLPIGWIVLNVIFLYQMTSEKGAFTILQDSLSRVTEDRRLQVLLVAFSFGAFFEGASGFGTPVAITGAILIGLGFSPLAASGLSLIANTAPVAYGALGTPVIALAAVTGLDIFDLSAMIGRQLPFFSILVPFWLVWAFAGFRAMAEIWPAVLIAGASFAIPQYLVSNLHGPWLVDVVAAICSIVALTLFLRVWHPRHIWRSTALRGAEAFEPAHAPASIGAQAVPDGGVQRRPPASGREVFLAWLPWLILSVVVFAWGTPQVKVALDAISVVKIPMAGLHEMVERVPPVVTKPAREGAIYIFNYLSATGSGILIAAIIAGFVMRFSPLAMLRIYGQTLWRVRLSLLTIAAMLAIGFTTRYAGIDATLGLTMAHAGVFYPFFGTLLGWLGVALTGSDTASNVLFGGLQRVSAEQLGLSPTLMAAANSSGGVMGKMIDAQSIVVASTATRWFGHEGDILRYVFFHSLALASLMGLLVIGQAYLWPLSQLVVR